MKRLLLGKAEHWIVLLLLMVALYAMGQRSLHVRAFVPFSAGLLALVVLALAFVVVRHRQGEAVTREPFEDAALPHGGRDEDEV